MEQTYISEGRANKGSSELPSLSIVVPCYNEQDVLPETCRQLVALVHRLHAEEQLVSAASRVFFVDDGSHDKTWKLIESYSEQGLPVVGIKLSRNCGHQRALLSGLLTADGDLVVSIDADLQDDVAAIGHMVKANLQDGAEIVYGVRHSRLKDSYFKRKSAQFFYRLMTLMGVESVPDHADFRLMSRRALNCLKQFDEVNLYLRGIIPLIGLKSARVYYARSERYAGQSKYPVVRMLALAWEAITSFSVVPLRLVTIAGFLVFAASIAVSAWVVWARLWSGAALPGWASTLLPIYFLGGVQILALGVIGEYLGKIYSESKRRPRFHIEQITNQDSKAGPDRMSAGED